MDELEILEEVLPIFAGILLLTLAFAVAVYVIDSLALYTIAKRRGLPYPWLAWLPIASGYITGCIADQYQRCVNRKTTYRAWILLGLAVAAEVLGLFASGGQFYSLMEAIENAASGNYSEISGDMLSASFGLGGLLSLATGVFTYIALYDIYRSCKPESAVLFLVLSILIPIALPFLLFSCRKYDNGMMPQQPTPPAGGYQNYGQNNWQGWQPPQQNYRQPGQNYRQPTQPIDTETDRAKEPWNIPEE